MKCKDCKYLVTRWVTPHVRRYEEATSYDEHRCEISLPPSVNRGGDNIVRNLEWGCDLGKRKAKK